MKRKKTPFDYARWPDYARQHESQAFTALVKHLGNDCGVPDTKPSRRHLHWLLIELARNLSHAPSQMIIFNRGKDTWPKSTKLKNGLVRDKTLDPYGITSNVIKVVDLLSPAYVTVHPGHFNKGKHDKRRSVASRIVPTKALRQTMNKFGVLPLISYLPEKAPKVRMRDESKQYVKPSGIAFQKAERQLVKDSDALLQRYNTLIAQTRLDLGIKADVMLDKTTLYRSFNRGSWTCGGRFYGGWWQNLPSAVRKTIRINGEPTVELDYSGQHIHMLYALHGERMPSGSSYDAYELPDATDRYGFPTRWSRDLVKRSILIAINAKSPKAAYNALCSIAFQSLHVPDKDEALEDELANQKYESWQERKDFQNIIKRHLLDFDMKNQALFDELLVAFCEKHPLIKSDLCSDQGIKLQRYDSDICMNVLKTMTDAEIPCLPVHDSFIVPERYEDTLYRAMEKAYEQWPYYNVSGVPVIKKDKKPLLE